MATLKYKDGNGDWQALSVGVISPDIVLTTGQSTTAVMSQKAVSTLLGEKQDAISDLSEFGNGIGTCSTSSGTALTVSLTGYELVTNSFVAVTFEYDVPANATLNINSKGAKPIYYKGSAITADTIKADDTVTFCYNGSQYVVTSLGGDGTAENGEIVVVKCSEDEGASVAGQTITINGTQYTLDATGIVSAKIPYGTQYSISASSWTDHITPATKTFTASLVLREVSMEWAFDDNSVDLGLPSGVRWCKYNLDVTTPNKLTASEYQYGASFFQWGNLDGHNPTSSTTFDYSFDDTTYANTPGRNLTGNLPSNATYDAARALLGGSWRIPTLAETIELCDNCDFVDSNDVVITGTNKTTTIQGIVGFYMKSKINGRHIFFPCCGRAHKTVRYDEGTNMRMWFSTLAKTDAVEGHAGVWPSAHYTVWHSGIVAMTGYNGNESVIDIGWDGNTIRPVR